MDAKRRKLSNDEKVELLEILEKRFEKHMERHKDLNWQEVLSKLEQNPEAGNTPCHGKNRWRTGCCQL